jgi:hypothetical protein
MPAIIQLKNVVFSPIKRIDVYIIKNFSCLVFIDLQLVARQAEEVT